jgi:hypothetical protein
MTSKLFSKVFEKINSIEKDILLNDKLIDKIKKKIYDNKKHNYIYVYNFILIQKMILNEKKETLLDVLKDLK